MADLIDFGAKVTYTNESPMRWGSEQAISGANKIREYNRQRAVEQAISKNYNPETLEFSEQGIAKDLADKGFGGTAEQVINSLKADRTKMSSEMADAIQKDITLMSQKVISPARFIEKWGKTQTVTATTPAQEQPVISQGQVSEQPSQTTSEQPIDLYAKKPETQTPKLPDNYFGNLDNPVSRKLFELYNKGKVQTPVETPVQSTVVNVPGENFVSKAPEYRLPEPTTQATEYKVDTKGPTTTTDYLAIDTTPEKLQELFPSVTSGPDIIKSSFSSKGMTQIEKDNLIRYLTRSGIDTSKGSLEDAVATFESDRIRSVPIPVPPQAGKNAIEERARYLKDVSDYNAKVVEAVNNARKDLRAGYGEVQGLTEAERTAQRAKEEYESKMQRIKNANVFDSTLVPPTAEGAKEVYDFLYEWTDIKDATESFPKAWAAAVSVARLDKNPTLENIVSNLVAMGAIPDKNSSVIKRLLEKDTSWTGVASDKVAGKIMNELDVLGLKPSGAKESWIQSQREKYRGKLKLNNALPIEVIEQNVWGAKKSGQKKETSDPNAPTKPQELPSVTPPVTPPQKSGAKKTADGLLSDAKKGAAKPTKPKPPRLDD